MMRSRPKWFGVSLGLLLACCSPSGGGSSPIQRIVQTPQTGGQTGDPGVADYTSIVEIAQGGGSAALPCVVVTDGADSSGALALGGAKLLPLGGGRLVVVDPLFGLRVLDIRDASAPVVEGQVGLGGLPVDMHVLGTQVLVLQRFAVYGGGRSDLQARYGAELELVRIDVSDPAHPTLVDRTKTARNRGLAMSHLVQHAQRAALYLVMDEASGTTTIRSFDVSAAQLAELSELDIGSSAHPHGISRGVRASEQMLAVASSDATVALIDLSAPDGTMTESQRVEGPDLPPLPDCDTNFTYPQAMDLSNGSLVVRGQSQLIVYDAHDVSVPREFARCDLQTTPDDVHFAGDLRFVIGDGSLIWVGSTGACTGSTARAALMGSRVLAIGLSAPDPVTSTWLVGLYDSATLAASSQTPLASAPADPSWLDADVSVLENAVQAKAADGTTETNLFAVPWIGSDPDGSQYGAPFEATRLFSFSDHTLTRRGLLRPAARVLALPSNTLAAGSQTELTLFDGSSLDAPKVLGQLPLSPAFVDAIDFGDFIVREHAPLGPPVPSYFQNASNPPQLAVDTVSSTEDPETGAALGSFSVPASARLVRAGNLLLSLSRSFDASGQIGAVDVFDLSDPSHPERTSTFSTASLGSPCYYCERAGQCTQYSYNCGSAPDLVPVPNGLIARVDGPYMPTRVDPTGSYTLPALPPALAGFLAIDLRDPAHPQTTLIPHDGGLLANAFAVGSRLYFSYYVPDANSNLADLDAWLGDVEQVRYYYRELDLSDLSAPVLGPPISLPGELMAVDGQGRLYTRSLTLAGSSPVAAVHRLELANAQARIVASHEVGDNTVQYVGLDGQGHLLAEVMGPGWGQYEVVEGEEVPYGAGPATRLLMLDAESLALVSEIEIDLGSVLRAQRDGRAIFEGSGGIFVVDLRDAQSPKLQAFHSLDLPTEPALLFDGRQIVIQASGGLRRIDAEETNL